MPIAEAIETYTLHEFVQAHDAALMIYDNFDDEWLYQQRFPIAEFDKNHALAAHAVRRQLAAISPALPDAMEEATSNLVRHGRTWLLRADIDNDGDDEVWLKTAGGRYYCETNWFYDSEPPYAFMGRIGSVGMEEDECGYDLDAIRINDRVLLAKQGWLLRLLGWSSTQGFEEVCNVQSNASGRFKTETVCAPSDQPVCDRIVELAHPLTQDLPANLAAGFVPDLAAVRIDGEGALTDTDLGEYTDFDDDGTMDMFRGVFGEYADVDNNGTMDIFVGRYVAGTFAEHEFSFGLIRQIDGRYRRSSPFTLTVWFGRKSELAAYPVLVDGRTYIVLRRHWEHGDPGSRHGHTLEILEIADDESRTVGIVNATPILDVTIEQP